MSQQIHESIKTMPETATNHSVQEFTPDIQNRTASIYERVKHVIPEVEWAIHAPVIAAINDLKRERNAVLLAHNYQTPEIFYGVGDICGDSLGLAQKGAETEADVIVMCGVHFMAETAKIMSPDKTILLPDMDAGCSLAASITGADVRRLKEQYPGVPVVTYVNTTAEVRAEADICCTSANALKIIESLGTERVIFIPDEYLGQYVAAQTDVEIILWKGCCEVHERFTGEELREYRTSYPGIHVMAHPECPQDVLKEADFVGSTTGMIQHVAEEQPEKVVLITECSMSDNVAVEFPSVEFIKPCNLCPYMKKITLPAILRSLQTMSPAIDIPRDISERARLSLEKMLAVGRA